MLKNSIIVIVFIWLGILTFNIWSAKSTLDEVKALNSQLSELITQQTKVQDEIRQLTIELVRLNKQKDIISETKKLIENSSNNDDLAQTPVKQKSGMDTQSLLDKNPAMAAFVKKMTSGEKFDPIETIGRRFSEQSVDYQWAMVYENNIQQLFASNANLTMLPLDKVTCRTDICEISIYSQDSPTFGAASLIAKSLANQKWRDPEASFIFRNKPKDGIIKFYLGKNEDSLKF